VEIHHLSPVNIQMSQVECFATLLSQAFHNEPRVAYILPEEVDRRSVLPWFFRSVAIRASQLCGEIYTTGTLDGGLWIRPGRESTFARIVQTEMHAAKFKLRRSSFRRWINLMRTHMEGVHRRLAKGPHWFLAALGVRSLNTVKASGALVEPVLSRADRDRLPCYVEIFHEPFLPFYEECGFEIAGAGQVPRGGPNFWAMIRPPHG